MWDMGHLGIPATDAVPGVDPATGSGTKGYGAWWIQSHLWSALDPVTYPPVPYVTIDPALCADYYASGRHRQVDSVLRPLTGVYSSSGQTAESLAKADLDLALLRTGADPRGRCTAWLCEVAGIAATEAGGNMPGGGGWNLEHDIRYKSFVTKLARAEAAGLVGVTFSYNGFTVAEAGYPDEAAELAVITSDITSYVELLKVSPAALRIKNGAIDPTGRLLIFLWVSPLIHYTPSKWNTLLEDVRSSTGEDFYVSSREHSGNAFGYADAVWPWAGVGHYAAALAAAAPGDSDRVIAAAWTSRRMASVAADAAAAGPDRVAMGSLFPGFEDWTMEFGVGNERLIPRSEDLILGQIDQYLADGITQQQVGTWNDYQEGTCWEPTVNRPGDTEDARELRYLTEGLARLYGETVVPAETAALQALWTDYEDPRACAATVPGGSGLAHAVVERKGEASTTHNSSVASVPQERGSGGVTTAGGVADSTSNLDRGA